MSEITNAVNLARDPDFRDWVRVGCCFHARSPRSRPLPGRPVTESRPHIAHPWAIAVIVYWVATPAPTAADQAADLKARIAALEQDCARPLREINLALIEGAQPPNGAVVKLANLEADIAALRRQLNDLVV